MADDPETGARLTIIPESFGGIVTYNNSAVLSFIFYNER